MNFWKYLQPPAPSKKGAPKPASAAELREAVGLAEAEAAATEGAAAGIAQERAALLLGADDTQLDDADRHLQLAQRAADRAAAAVAALSELVRAAEARERAEGLDKLYNEGAAALAGGVERYSAYAARADEIADLMRQMEQAQATIARINAALRAAGDPRSIPGLDEHARPERSALRLLRVPLWQQVRLPTADHPQNSAWPPHKQVDIPPPAPRPPLSGSLGPPAEPRAPGVVRW